MCSLIMYYQGTLATICNGNYSRTCIVPMNSTISCARANTQSGVARNVNRWSNLLHGPRRLSVKFNESMGDIEGLAVE